jgi:hypothetical protein
MMSRLWSRSTAGLLYLEAPPLAVSLVVAEPLFKFHSFTLEALAFIGLWYALSGVYWKALSFLSERIGLFPHPDVFHR